MSKGFDPLDLPESNATSYPEPYRAENQRRWNRRLGDHAGLANFGVNLTRIVPGGQSSAATGIRGRTSSSMCSRARSCWRRMRARRCCAPADAPDSPRATATGTGF